MKLEFLGHDERYIVEQSLMTLFPLEKPTYDAVQPEDEAWCRLAASSSGTVSAGGVMEVESFEGSTTIFRGNGGGLSGHSGAALSRIHRRRDLCIPPHRHGL